MFKIDRVNSEIKKQVIMIINRDLENPNIDGNIVITNVDTTQDLSLSKIKVSISHNKKKEETIIDALNHSSNFMRRILRERLNIRNVPKLVFKQDIGYSNTVRIEQLLNKINKEK